MIRALIVDDMKLARENIRIRLRKHPDVVVVGEASSAREALVLVSKCVPELLFLDIELPGADGFKVLKDLRQAPPPAVIFVTAHDQYAVKAFEANAAHYLLKPIDDEQFEQALERARQAVASHKQQANGSLAEACSSARTFEGPKPCLERIAVRDGQNFRVLKVESIDWIESDGNYIRLHAKGQAFTARMALGEIERQLNPGRFARISKSIVMNLDSVVEIKRLWHGDFEVLLTDRAHVRMSRRYRAQVLPDSNR
jgi:two-component system LytT family response regulator